MATGLNIEGIPNRVTELSDDALVYGGEVGGSSYIDAALTKANLLKEDRARLTANEADIDALETSVSSLQDNFTFTKRASDNTAFQVQQDENAYLFMIGFLNVGSTNPTVSVGTTEGGDDIVSSREITESTRILITGNYEPSDDTLYFTVTGGAVATTIIFMKNYFNI